MTQKAETYPTDISVLKVTKGELKKMVERLYYRPLVYSGIPTFHVRGYQQFNAFAKKLCRREDFRDARNTKAR